MNGTSIPVSRSWSPDDRADEQAGSTWSLTWDDGDRPTVDDDKDGPGTGKGFPGPGTHGSTWS